MELKNVVPWGRSFNEYQKMFSLTAVDLGKKILGAGDGPASFNAECTQAGGKVVSIDPIYRFCREEIRARIDEVYPQIMSQMAKCQEDYLWGSISCLEELGRVRMAAMGIFLEDYETGRQSGRYVSGSLPVLPFEDKAFDLALCSHYLFLYSDQVSQEQHLLSMKELCRVANEVRVYPLVSLDGAKSKYLDYVMSALEDDGVNVSLKHVEYQFQRGAMEMLVARPTSFPKNRLKISEFKKHG